MSAASQSTGYLTQSREHEPIHDLPPVHYDNPPHSTRTKSKTAHLRPNLRDTTTTHEITPEDISPIHPTKMNPSQRMETLQTIDIPTLSLKAVLVNAVESATRLDGVIQSPPLITPEVSTRAISKMELNGNEVEFDEIYHQTNLEKTHQFDLSSFFHVSTLSNLFSPLYFFSTDDSITPTPSPVGESVFIQHMTYLYQFDQVSDKNIFQGTLLQNLFLKFDLNLNPTYNTPSQDDVFAQNISHTKINNNSQFVNLQNDEYLFEVDNSSWVLSATIKYTTGELNIDQDLSFSDDVIINTNNITFEDSSIENNSPNFVFKSVEFSLIPSQGYQNSQDKLFELPSKFQNTDEYVIQSITYNLSIDIITVITPTKPQTSPSAMNQLSQIISDLSPSLILSSNFFINGYNSVVDETQKIPSTSIWFNTTHVSALPPITGPQSIMNSLGNSGDDMETKVEQKINMEPELEKNGSKMMTTQIGPGFNGTLTLYSHQPPVSLPIDSHSFVNRVEPEDVSVQNYLTEAEGKISELIIDDKIDYKIDQNDQNFKPKKNTFETLQIIDQITPIPPYHQFTFRFQFHTVITDITHLQLRINSLDYMFFGSFDRCTLNGNPITKIIDDNLFDQNNIFSQNLFPPQTSSFAPLQTISTSPINANTYHTITFGIPSDIDLLNPILPTVVREMVDDREEILTWPQNSPNELLCFENSGTIIRLSTVYQYHNVPVAQRDPSSNRLITMVPIKTPFFESFWKTSELNQNGGDGGDGGDNAEGNPISKKPLQIPITVFPITKSSSTVSTGSTTITSIYVNGGDDNQDGLETVNYNEDVNNTNQQIKKSIPTKLTPKLTNSSLLLFSPTQQTTTNFDIYKAHTLISTVPDLIIPDTVTSKKTFIIITVICVVGMAALSGISVARFVQKSLASSKD
jgi:hypothetical protein